MIRRFTMLRPEVRPPVVPDNISSLFTNGRWKTDKTQEQIIHHIDLANHDHCGGESCQRPDVKIADDKPAGGTTSTPQKIDDDDDETWYWPFLL